MSRAIRDRSEALGNAARLVRSSLATNTADGAAIVAYPWIASELTNSAVAIVMVGALQRLPWLVLSIPFGSIVDRTDKRSLVVRCDVARAVIAGAIAMVLVLAGDDGTKLIALLLVMPLLGSLEVLRDGAARALLPEYVPSGELVTYSGRLAVAEYVGNFLLGSLLAAALIGIDPRLPLLLITVAFVSAAATNRSLRSTGVTRTDPGEHDGVDDRPGLSAWRVIRSGPLARVAYFVGVSNFLEAMAGAALVLYARWALGSGPIVLSALGVAMAVGGVVGGMVAGRIAARVPTATLLLPVALTSAIAHIVLGLPLVLAAALVAFVSLGLAEGLWNAVSYAWRVQLTPPELLGRVNGVFQTIGIGTVGIGALVGGVALELFRGPLGDGEAVRLLWALVGVGSLAAGLVFLRPAALRRHASREGAWSMS